MSIFKIKVIGNEKERNVFQELIDSWKPVRDVWLLKHGDKIVTTVAGINGLLINQMFRHKLRLHYKGFITTSIFLSLSPAISTYISYKYFIVDKILQYKHTCAMCQEMKGILYCYGTGIVHPLIIAPLINIAIAGSIGYRIPYLTEVSELTKFWWSVVRPKYKTISLILLFNALITGSVVYFQMKSMDKVVDVVINFDYKDNKVKQKRNKYNQLIGDVLND